MIYKNRYDLLKRNRSFYNFLNTNHPEILDKYLQKKLPYSLEECKLSAKGYTTRMEWCREDGGKYSRAVRQGWLDKCCKHMIDPSIKWTKNSCIKEAKKYKTRNEWRTTSMGSYNVARKNRWLKKCQSHFNSHGNTKYYLNLNTKKIYESLSAAAISVKRSASAICNAAQVGTKCGGYHWAYCDKNGKILK